MIGYEIFSFSVFFFLFALLQRPRFNVSDMYILLLLYTYIYSIYVYGTTYIPATSNGVVCTVSRVLRCESWLWSKSRSECACAQCSVWYFFFFFRFVLVVRSQLFFHFTVVQRACVCVVSVSFFSFSASLILSKHIQHTVDQRLTNGIHTHETAAGKQCCMDMPMLKIHFYSTAFFSSIGAIHRCNQHTSCIHNSCRSIPIEPSREKSLSWFDVEVYRNLKILTLFGCCALNLNIHCINIYSYV